MKKIHKIFALFCLLFSNVLAAQSELPAVEFEKRLNTQQSQLLEVRTAREYQSGHLKNALQADWLKKEEFLERVKYLDKSKPILVYCASGIRSAAAMKWLQDNGFSNVQNLKGGIVDWKKEGKPVDAAIATAQLTGENYISMANSSSVTLVDFGAEWCPPCKAMEPVLKQLQSDLPGKFKLVKVDADIATDIMKEQKIDMIPTFIVYKNGKEVWRKSGVTELAELKKHLK